MHMILLPFLISLYMLSVIVLLRDSSYNSAPLLSMSALIIYIIFLHFIQLYILVPWILEDSWFLFKLILCNLDGMSP